MDSIRQLELQCKERVELLETLKKSREESKESLASPTPELNVDAPTPPTHGVPLTSSYTNESSGWLGGGSIPPMEYADLGRPPPLPYRPAMPPRKISASGSIRDNSLAKTVSASTLTPGHVEENKSRTPSPDKKGRMLRTLRPGRDGKSSSSTTKLPSSMRSRPEASKAATQAWSYGSASKSSRPSLGLPNPSTTSLSISARSSMDNATTERPTSQSSYMESPQPQAQAPSYFRSGEGSASNAYAVPSMSSGNYQESDKLPGLSKMGPPIPRKSVELGRISSAPTNSAPANSPGLPSYPSYRKEYPTPTPLHPRSLAASAAARSYSDVDNEKNAPPQDARTKRREVPSATNNNTRSRNARSQGNSEPIALGEDEDEPKPRSTPTRKGRVRGNSIRAELPPTETSVPADPEEEAEESDEWKRRTDDIMKNLPRGVDKQAAQQILNEIVIQGDEVHWDDVAGLEIAKSALKETVVYPFLRPDLFMGLREPARGMLLFGPPGTGKTMLARAVATESKSTFFAISASSLTSKFLGESEKLVRALFQLAKVLAPSIIFVDEIDSLLSSRSGSGEHEATRRIKTEFLIQWSDLQKAAAGRDMSDKEKERGDATRVLVLAATNLPWAIDEAARRRFVRRQYIPLPEDWVRKKQVQTLLGHQKHELSERDLDRLVRLTEGIHMSMTLIPLFSC